MAVRADQRSARRRANPARRAIKPEGENLRVFCIKRQDSKVKNAVKIPVVGNGDIFSADAAKTMLEVTGCDGIMIARGAMGNPWIFDELAAYFEGRQYTKPSTEEIIKEAIHHLDLMCEFKEEQFAIPEARKIMSYYIHDTKGASAARGKLNMAATKEEMRDILLSLIE